MTTSRYLRFAITGVALLTIGSGPAPAQKGSSRDYWPLKQGNSWTLETKAGDVTIVMTATVTKVVKEPQGTRITVDYISNGQSIQVETYRLTKNALLRMQSGTAGSGTISPPMPLIRYPLKAGASWTWKGTLVMPGQSGAGVAKLTVSGPETIKTPAGKFQAMRVHSNLTIEMQGQKLNIPNDYWFAPGIGIVQQKIQIGPQTVNSKLLKYKVK